MYIANSTKNSHRIPKKQISVPEFLNGNNSFCLNKKIFTFSLLNRYFFSLVLFNIRMEIFFKGLFIWCEMARLRGLVHLGEMIFIPRSYKVLYNSFCLNKKIFLFSLLNRYFFSLVLFNIRMEIFFKGLFIWCEMARLRGLVHLGEMIFIPRSYKVLYLGSFKKFMSLKKGCFIKPFFQKTVT